MELTCTEHGVSLGLEWKVEEPDYPGRAWPVERIAISGLCMHTNAIRVQHINDDPSNGLEAFQDDFEDDLEAIYLLNGNQALQTIELEGPGGEPLEGMWVIVAYPHGE